MPTTQVYLPNSVPHSTEINPLPQLLQLPSGLAILELQGDINFPNPEESPEGLDSTTVGNIVFPDGNPGSTDIKELKRVWLYVGKHQRMTGEVKQLPKPLGVLRKRHEGEISDNKGTEEELEIVDIIKYKIIFSKRPEPVGTAAQ